MIHFPLRKAPDMKTLALILAAALSATALAKTPKGWNDDFETAQKLAARDAKPMLVLFTGSDWCPWCVRLEQEVFAKAEFATVIPKEMVPVFLDFPRDEGLVTPVQRSRNEALARKYGIRGFPTVLLVDAKGGVIARTGYRPGGPEAYVSHLRDLVAAKKSAAKAEKKPEAK